MSANRWPYSRPAPVQLVCVGTRTRHRATSYEVADKIKIASYKTTSSSVLTNGERIYMTHENGSIPSFAEGLAYIIKDYDFYVKNGNNCISLGPTTKMFRCAPLDIAEDVQRRARNILNPPSLEMTGDEDDIFIRSSFVSLNGYIEKVREYYSWLQLSHAIYLDLDTFKVLLFGCSCPVPG